MRKSIKGILTIIIVMAMALSAVGCAGRDINTPDDAIKDAFGDRQFRISFDSTTLDEPLNDVYYSANTMPKLPIPTKVGHVFAGWYFDALCTKPCDVSSNDLLWKMCDLTLYPKWEREQIYNNGTYEIEYSAKIVEDSIVMGPLARDEYQRFTDDIVASETYIEKNDKGTFLRIQYDNVVRGPVLGGEDADEGNFSKMTYTVTDRENRINEELSIQDRTNTIQTIYYDLKDRELTDTIKLHIEYYDWTVNLDDKIRNKASVGYDVEFDITRFIGFDQAFLNPEGRLADGFYLVPTHYTGLDKSQAMLDMFNPVYAYIEARGGKYTLHKPLNTYNNDFPEVTPVQFPLRTSGYAREFACMYIHKDKVVPESILGDKTGAYYVPEELDATRYAAITYELHADTGKYYYTIDLGNTLDNDLVFIGGSAGAMEQMFSFPFEYRRLTIGYNSMVKLAECDYAPLFGNEYTFRQSAMFYPGSAADFDGTATAHDIYESYRQAIDMTNIFFSQTANGGVGKLYDTKMTIAPAYKHSNPSDNRYTYERFDIQLSAYGYNPVTDGDLFARDLTFTTHSAYRSANSSVNRKLIGKTFAPGERVSIATLFRDKIFYTNEALFSYKAYKVDDALNVDYSAEVDVDYTFDMKDNLAILYTLDRVSDGTRLTGLVYVMKKETLNIDDIIDGNREWTLVDGVYTTKDRFKMGEGSDGIVAPEVRYRSYGVNMTTSGLKKYDEDDITSTDFTCVSAWDYAHGKYTNISIIPGSDEDFFLRTEKTRVVMQLMNPFGEFENIEFEYRGEESGEYELKLGTDIVKSGDIKYKGNVREKISHEMHKTYNIRDEITASQLPASFDLVLRTDSEGDSVEQLVFENASIYLESKTLEVTAIDDIWASIKDEPYAVVYLYYSDAYGDMVIYKAQYNFRLDGKDIKDNVYFINSRKTIFTYNEYEFRKPMITDKDVNLIDSGRLNIFKKNGNNWETPDEKDLREYSQTYTSNIKFYKPGTYMLAQEYDLYKDETGKYVFAHNEANSYNSLIKINICQEVEVVAKDSDITVTFATDLAHKVKESKRQELIDLGYTITEDAEYQYLTIVAPSGKKTFAPTIEYFEHPSGEILFVWSIDKTDETLRPGYMIRSDLAVKTGTLTPKLYAWWDKGISIDVSYQMDDVTRLVSTGNRFIRNPDTGGGYTVFFSQLAAQVKPYIPVGYELVGWRASEAIFTDKVNIDGVTHWRPSNYHNEGYKGSVILYKKVDFTGILKKTANVSYEAVDMAGAPLEFMKELRTDYGVYIGDKFNDVISNEKLKELSKVTAAGKKFDHWEAYDKTLAKWVRVDLDTLVLEERYANSKGAITLRAVFGNKG